MGDAALVKNLQQQLVRLLEQLKDLEEEKSNLEPGEYDEMREDTLTQLEELDAALDKLKSGNMSMIDEIGAIKIATRSAISKAFKTPEIIALFAKKETGSLRRKLAELENEGRIDSQKVQRQKGEILLALKGLNEVLTQNESDFMKELAKQDEAFQINDS